jgi:hypothetical protein
MLSSNASFVSSREHNHTYARIVSHGSAFLSQLAMALALTIFGAGLSAGQSNSFQANPNAGPGKIIVQSKFGGRIYGFDIDQNGSEGLLSEAGGRVNAAVETFDQKTGKILDVVVQTKTQDDFITLGVVGNSVGLVEHEHVKGIYVVKRNFGISDPLDSNKVTGLWTPPIGSDHIIMGVSRNQGEPYNSIFAYDNSGNFIPYVFGTNVAANTFGPVVKITDSYDFGSVPPPMAFDTKTNQALLGGGPGCFDCFPVIGVVDLVKGTFSTFEGIGFGFVNGAAVDPDDGILCTDTEDDATVEFYDLATQKGFTVILPGSQGQQIYSGADIEYDPIHKVFLVAQPVSSSSPTGSTIYVYDTEGNVLETLNGFNFSNTFNVIAMHIALHPNLRAGYVDGPDQNVTEIQSFTY